MTAIVQINALFATDPSDAERFAVLCRGDRPVACERKLQLAVLEMAIHDLLDTTVDSKADERRDEVLRWICRRDAWGVFSFAEIITAALGLDPAAVRAELKRQAPHVPRSPRPRQGRRPRAGEPPAASECVA